VQNEWLAVSPFKHGITLREQEHPIRYFTDQEMHRILDACVGPIAHVRPMIEFCLLTDCRTAEMLCLRWEDVDFEGSRIHFRNTKTAVDRFVKMGLELRRLLYNLPRFEGCEWVFPSPRILRPYGHTSKKYQRFLPQFPRKVWNTIRKRAMLTDKAAVPYGFRRTSATILAKNLGLHEAQEILGHSDIATTRRYAAVVADTYDRAAEVLEERVSRAVNGGRQ
jgi:integrase